MSEIRDSQSPRLTVAEATSEIRDSQAPRVTVAEATSQIQDSQAIRLTVIESPQDVRDSQAVRLVVLELPPDEEAEFEDDQDGTTIGLHWIHFFDSAAVEHVWSKVDLADPSSYYGGFKSGIVMRWGTIKRALSDRRGQYEASSFSWTVSDTLREIRGLLASATTRFLTGRNVIMRSIPDAARRALLVPRTVVRGIVRGYKPISPLHFEFTAEDYFAAKFQVGTEEAQLPKRKIGRIDFPNVPVDTIDQPVPIVYGAVGEETSATAAPTITGDAARGAFISEGLWHAGYGNLPSAAAVPTGVVTGTASGGTLSTDVPNGEYGVLVTAVDAGGVESDPQFFFTDSDFGGSRGSFAPTLGGAGYTETPDGTEKITVSWSASAGAVKYRVYLLTYYYGARAGQVLEVTAPTTSCEFTAGPSWTEVLTAANITPGATPTNFDQSAVYAVTAIMADGETSKSVPVTGVSHPYRRPIRIEWLPVAGALGYRVYRAPALPGAAWDRRWDVSSAVAFFEDDLLDTGVTFLDVDDAPRGGVPVTYVGQTADDSGFVWETFLVAGHALKETTAWYLDGVRVDSGTGGVTWLVPGFASTIPYTTYFASSGALGAYRDINGRRYAILYVRGPDGSNAAAGTSTITLNAKGIEDVGDGSGNLITSIPLQYRHALQNWMIGDYQSGAWLASPAVPDEPTLLQIDDDSFEAVDLILQDRIAGGYVGAGMIGAKGEFVTLRDLMARWHLSGDFDGGFTRKTQFAIYAIDDAIGTVADARDFDQVSDIFADTFEIEDEVPDMFNVVPVSYNRDFTGLAKTEWRGTAEESSADSIANYQETRTAQRVYLHFVRTPGVAVDIAQRRLLLSKDPPRRVVFTTGLRGLSVELGDVITVTHGDGIGANGWTRQPIRVVRHEFDPDRYTITIEGYDAGRVYDGAFILGDEDALAAWAVAAPSDRSYGYLADETTEQFSDGAPIKRLR